MHACTIVHTQAYSLFKVRALRSRVNKRKFGVFQRFNVAECVKRSNEKSCEIQASGSLPILRLICRWASLSRCVDVASLYVCVDCGLRLATDAYYYIQRTRKMFACTMRTHERVRAESFRCKSIIACTLTYKWVPCPRVWDAQASVKACMNKHTCFATLPVRQQCVWVNMGWNVTARLPPSLRLENESWETDFLNFAASWWKLLSFIRNGGCWGRRAESRFFYSSAMARSSFEAEAALSAYRRAECREAVLFPPLSLRSCYSNVQTRKCSYNCRKSLRK